VQGQDIWAVGITITCKRMIDPDINALKKRLNVCNNFFVIKKLYEKVVTANDPTSIAAEFKP
jgi:hypothetical protein